MLKSVIMNRFVFPLSALILLFATACEREDEDLISGPTPTSIIIEGTICTPDGQPFSDIPVSVDYEFSSIVAHVVKHKGRATTDRNGRYSVFFEVGEDKAPAGDVQRCYWFSVDLSRVSPETYIRPEEKLDFFLRVEDREGETLRCDFAIPRKKYVKVNVENPGLCVPGGTFAVMNNVLYGAGWGVLDGGSSDEPCRVTLFEPIGIPADGVGSAMLPCGVGIPNFVTVVYKGNEEIQYGNGVPASDTREVSVTSASADDLTFTYTVPDL